MTFFINSPLGGGANFATGAVDNIRGERGVGFFRLNMTVSFVIESAWHRCRPAQNRRN
jgi:hypothetical protein